MFRYTFRPYLYGFQLFVTLVRLCTILSDLTDPARNPTLVSPIMSPVGDMLSKFSSWLVPGPALTMHGLALLHLYPRRPTHSFSGFQISVLLLYFSLNTQESGFSPLVVNGSYPEYFTVRKSHSGKSDQYEVMGKTKRGTIFKFQ